MGEQYFAVSSFQNAEYWLGLAMYCRVIVRQPLIITQDQHNQSILLLLYMR